MAPLRLGVVGAAAIAKKNCRSIGLIGDIEVVAIASRTLEKAEAFIKEVGLSAKAYGSYEELLADGDVDAVYIPLPTALHVEWVRKAAAAKKHILLEKPIALSEPDIDAIMKAAKDAGIVIMDGTMWSHGLRAQKVREVLESGALGKVTLTTTAVSFAGLESTEFASKNIRVLADGDPMGALGDIGWYCVRCSLFTYGFEPPAKVFAHPYWTHNDAGVPTRGGATLLWKDGRRAIVDFGFDLCLRQHWEIVGTQGTLRIDDMLIPHKPKEAKYWVTSNHGLVDYDSVDTTETAEVTLNLEIPHEASMWVEFAKCIRGESDPAFWANIADLTQRVCCKIWDSQRAGGVEVSM